MENKKIILGVLTLISIGIGILLSGITGINFSGVSANPDYICKKSVSGQPCNITSCGVWQKDGTRICNGNKTTEVSYYLIRTSCEPGYTQVRNCYEVNLPGIDGEFTKQMVCGGSNGASGRNSADRVSKSESCTITQVDTISPDGDIGE